MEMNMNKNSSIEKMEIEGDIVSEDESLIHLQLCFKKLDNLAENGKKNEKSSLILSKILPHLANEYLSTNQLIFEKFKNSIDFSKETGYIF
jgi:hypothetical protein